MPKAEKEYFELRDNSVAQRSAFDFFNIRKSREMHATAARLAEQFELQNRSRLALLDVRARAEFDGNNLRFQLESSSTIGAVPLLSPTRGTADYGLLVQPRFSWSGVGRMLSHTGWKILPQILRLPLFARSDSRIPRWVISSIVVPRIYELLRSIVRGFKLIHTIRPIPHGTVNWNRYAIQHVSRADYLSVPCAFSTLQSDERLRGAIKYTTELHRQSLLEQVEAGPFVVSLVDMCAEILSELRDIEPIVPTPREFTNWLKRPMRNDSLMQAIEAMQWTAEERGLAGASDMSGLPWAMRMDDFFEAWIETLLQVVAKRTGGKLRSGRLRQTVRPIEWDPAYVGSQKALIPDLWLEWPKLTAIVDAKYKRHFEELNLSGWGESAQVLREQHRQDLLQVLAYAALAGTQDVIVCLTYPCEPNTWASLRARGRLFHRAEVGVPDRRLQLWLTATPIGGHPGDVLAQFENEFRMSLSRAQN
jgi:hypothetical protein